MTFLHDHYKYNRRPDNSNGCKPFIGDHPLVFSTGRNMVRYCFSPFFCIETRNAQRLNQDGPVVLLPKHQRWEDIPLLGLASPHPLFFVAKYELFRQPWMAKCLQYLGGIALNRKKPLQSRRSFKQVVELLACGRRVVIFPEGTYYPDAIGTGHAGMIRFILSRSRPRFLPVGIRYEKQGRRTHVCIRFGRPETAAPDIPVHQFLENMLYEIGRLSGMVSN
ncbi:MAG: 1-acyl-sn-glycerol-3-phosphate acyltransferase [Desulfobacteraceae bacterium]|nr:1-acyl-sn-glycerol-3-phosphate acyltransferase [Desulfobacteraceae bacterium]